MGLNKKNPKNSQEERSSFDSFKIKSDATSFIILYIELQFTQTTENITKENE